MIANHARLGNTLFNILPRRLGHEARGPRYDGGEHVSSTGSKASLKITIMLLRKPIKNAR